MGACSWRANKLSRESDLGWVGAGSTEEPAVLNAAGTNAALVSAGCAAVVAGAACAFEMLAVCATSANGTASGSTKNPPDG